jgi:hypothetical protein
MAVWSTIGCASHSAQRMYQPQPVILRKVKSVCQSWLTAVVLSLNSFAALITT